MPYFIGSRTLFHNSMEDLLNNKPAEKITEWSPSEKMSLAADLDVAIARWNKVKAVEAGDEKEFSETLGKLKPNFIKTFFLFGEFPG